MEHRGFTLIELLVVISIISLLSSVALASLGAARLKARDAAIKSQLVHIKKQAEVYALATGNGAYGTIYGIDGDSQVCPAGGSGSIFYTSVAAGGLSEQINNLHDLTGMTPSCAAGSSTGGAATSWAVSALLPSGQNGFCLDNSGELMSGIEGTSYPAAVLSGNVASCILYYVPTNLPCAPGECTP